MTRTIVCFLTLFSMAATASPSVAQSLFGQKTDYASVYLHSGRAMADGRRKAALRVELQPGWKTYWRNPGDAGIPPHFDWEGSTNLKAATIAWPTPLVFDTYGSRTIGYEERMILPILLTPENPGEAIQVRLNFTYGLCREICIPAQQDFTMEIAPNAAEDGGYFLDRAAATAPVSAAEGGLSVQECKVEGAGKQRRFIARLSIDQPVLSTPVIIAEGPEGVWFGPIATYAEGGALTGEGPVETEAGRWIDRATLRLTVLGAERAISLKGCAATG